jgi:hypothetical protein
VCPFGDDHRAGGPCLNVLQVTKSRIPATEHSSPPVHEQHPVQEVQTGPSATCGKSQKDGFACAFIDGAVIGPSHRHQAGASKNNRGTNHQLWRRKMGDGVTGSVNAPVNQTPNTANSGAASRANATAQAQFGQVLAQESLCPSGLGRPPHVGSFPSRYDPPCTYLRPPSQEPPKPDKPVGIPPYTGNPDNLRGPPFTRPTGTDYTKPIPPSTSKGPQVPEGPKHSGGLGEGDGGHIFSWEGKHNKL